MVKLFKVLLNKNQKVSTCSKTYLNLNPMGHLYSQTRQNFLFDHSKHIYHCVKNRPNTEFFSGPYFPEFGLSTENTGQKKLRIFSRGIFLKCSVKFSPGSLFIVLEMLFNVFLLRLYGLF